MKDLLKTTLAGFLILMMLPTPSRAANPGDSCTAGQSGQVQTDQGTMIVCNGSVWNAAIQLSNNAGRILFQVDNDAGSCTAAKLGRLKYSSSASPSWQYCNGSAWTPFDSASVSSTPGFLVQTATKWNGNLGGLSGANAKCLTELQTTYNWTGKSIAGTLTASRVYAVLCDGASCNNLKPSTPYFYAKANVIGNAACNWGVLTDTSGRGPNNALYDDGCFTSNTWMNRGTVNVYTWATTKLGTSHCSNWGSASGSGAIGSAGFLDDRRWDNGTSTCATANFLLCAVDP